MGFLIIGSFGGLSFSAAALYFGAPLWLALLVYSIAGAAVAVLAAALSFALRPAPQEHPWPDESWIPAE